MMRFSILSFTISGTSSGLSSSCCVCCSCGGRWTGRDCCADSLGFLTVFSLLLFCKHQFLISLLKLDPRHFQYLSKGMHWHFAGQRICGMCAAVVTFGTCLSILGFRFSPKTFRAGVNLQRLSFNGLALPPRCRVCPCMQVSPTCCVHTRSRAA